MTDDIKIWEVDGSSRTVEPVTSTDWKGTESSFEEVLLKNPDMLMPGLTLVGRQTPTENGALDLLGVDEDGRLVVFELKRDKPTRVAVAQAIDYCSYLESLAETELAAYISRHSGKNGVEEIDDFESWYGDRQGKQLISLKPTKMALVGLGADARAHRMVEFLAESGVDISLLTFHGYQYGNKTLLAKQVEGSVETHDVKPGPRQSSAELRRALDERARELDSGDLWRGAVTALDIASMGIPRKEGITFYQYRITLPDNANVYASHSVVIDQSGKIRVTFFPGAVDVCWDKFQAESETIPFKFEKPPNAPTTKRAPEQWYCLLDKKKWETHKETLIALTKDVHDEWRGIRHGGSTT